MRLVFCDIKEDDDTIDTGRIEELITETISTIMPIHVYGTICDVDAIWNITKQYRQTGRDTRYAL